MLRAPTLRSRRRSARSSPRASSRSCSAATTRSRSLTFARAPRPHGPVGLVHFDTHTDTGTQVFGVEVSHGTPMYRLVRDGHVDPSRYVQIGLRGYWPGEPEFAWQAEQGITSLLHARRARARHRRASSSERCRSSARARCFSRSTSTSSIPAFAPGTGTPEPGGMTSADLLWAVAHARGAARARRRRRRRGDPDRGGIRRRDRARRRPDRAGDPDRDRSAAPPTLSACRKSWTSRTR